MPYLDHHSASPLRPGVAALMAEVGLAAGNASSVHQLGRTARRRLQTASGHVQQLVGAHASETDVILCASLAEARSLSIWGLAQARRSVAAHKRCVILDSTLWAACPGLLQKLSQAGFALGQINFAKNAAGAPNLQRRVLASGSWAPDLAPIAPESVALVAVSGLSAQGERPRWDALGAWCLPAEVPVVVDASVAAGRTPLAMATKQWCAVIVDGPPLGGPAGATCVVWRKAQALQPLWSGGGQHLERRSGTEAVVLAAGLGEAARLAHASHERAHIEMGALRAALCATTSQLVLPPDCTDLVLWPQDAAAVTRCVALFDAAGVMVGWQKGLGSSCRPALRLSLGWSTTAEDIARAAPVLARLVGREKDIACAS